MNVRCQWTADVVRLPIPWALVVHPTVCDGFSGVSPRPRDSMDRSSRGERVSESCLEATTRYQTADPLRVRNGNRPAARGKAAPAQDAACTLQPPWPDSHESSRGVLPSSLANRLGQKRRVGKPTFVSRLRRCLCRSVYRTALARCQKRERERSVKRAQATLSQKHEAPSTPSY